MKNIEELVEKWNEAYRQLGQEIRIKDMCDDDYGETIADLLYDVAGSWETAAEIFLHKNNKGGWMLGDAHGIIQRKIVEERMGS